MASLRINLYARRASNQGLTTMCNSRTTHAVPFTQDAQDTHAPVTEPKLAGQVWIQGEPQVRLYSSPQAALSAASKAEADGKKVRVVFVHDRQSGIKLFADRVWFVEKNGDTQRIFAEDRRR